MDRERWDAKYAAKGMPTDLSADDWLVSHLEKVIPGNALELACGFGQNAQWMSRRGWNVDAVDISSIGLDIAKQFAEQTGCPPIQWIAADLDEFQPKAASYDLVVVFRFLDRQRLPSLIESALRPGGLLIYETFSRSQLSRSDNHLKSSDFTLAPGELPMLFPRLIVQAAEEVELADRNVSRLVARKR